MANTVKIRHQHSLSVKISLGQIYLRNDVLYILGKADHYENCKRAALISLWDGNIWTYSTEVKDVYNISIEEFEKITAGKQFELFKGTLEITTND